MLTWDFSTKKNHINITRGEMLSVKNDNCGSTVMTCRPDILD